MTPTQDHPQFVVWIRLLAALPFQLVLILWVGGFFGSVLTAFLDLQGMAAFVVLGLLAFLGVPFFADFGKNRTAGTLYDDHIGFEEGFFSHNLELSGYRDVVEVTLRKGVLQRLAGLGTISLGPDVAWDRIRRIGYGERQVRVQDG